MLVVGLPSERTTWPRFLGDEMEVGRDEQPAAGVDQRGDSPRRDRAVAMGHHDGLVLVVDGKSVTSIVANGLPPWFERACGDAAPWATMRNG
jgi:hypothetical protein